MCAVILKARNSRSITLHCSVCSLFACVTLQNVCMESTFALDCCCSLQTWEHPPSVPCCTRAINLDGVHMSCHQSHPAHICLYKAKTSGLGSETIRPSQTQPPTQGTPQLRRPLCYLTTSKAPLGCQTTGYETAVEFKSSL